MLALIQSVHNDHDPLRIGVVQQFDVFVMHLKITNFSRNCYCRTTSEPDCHVLITFHALTILSLFECRCCCSYIITQILRQRNTLRNEHVAYAEALADFQGYRLLSFYQHSLLQPDSISVSLTTDL